MLLVHFLGLWPAPRGQHYAAEVDMLTRVGRFQDAYDFVKILPGFQ
jgi:hypothetical protein